METSRKNTGGTGAYGPPSSAHQGARSPHITPEAAQPGKRRRRNALPVTETEPTMLEEHPGLLERRSAPDHRQARVRFLKTGTRVPATKMRRNLQCIGPQHSEPVRHVSKGGGGAIQSPTIFLRNKHHK